MLAKLSASLPSGDARWAYEMKWDGIRAMVFVAGGALTIRTRNQIDVTKRYPELHPVAVQLAGHDVILDGEIVGFDAQGKPSL